MGGRQRRVCRGEEGGGRIGCERRGKVVWCEKGFEN